MEENVLSRPKNEKYSPSSAIGEESFAAQFRQFPAEVLNIEMGHGPVHGYPPFIGAALCGDREVTRACGSD